MRHTIVFGALIALIAILTGGSVARADDIISNDAESVIQGSLCLGAVCPDDPTIGAEELQVRGTVPDVNFIETDNSNYKWRQSVSAGIFTLEDVEEGERFILTPDDGISLVGRVCIGPNCGSSETFPQDHTNGVMKINGTNPALIFDDVDNPQLWGVAGNGSSGASLRINDHTASTIPFQIEAGGAPTNSLFVDSTGNIGLGVANPNNALDIRRNVPNGDIFASIGVNPATGPSFNYGYGGATFGIGAGFFNARPAPGSSAPNPSIRFMTANVQGMILDNQQFLGLGVAGFDPIHPIHHQASGAHLTTAGTWTDVSSRAAKQDVVTLDAADAYATLAALEPVHYRYITDATDPRVGFIAEDVPELVATPERTGLSALDITAVLTKVVQEQQKTITDLLGTLAAVLDRLATLEQAR